ncbi:MAG: DNA repair protein RecN [Bryobacterales bacterium]
MLHELNIENYAVVEKLRVRFHGGLNLLTGETGSGKSILVDALSLLLGARATADVIRPGSGRARVSAVFEVEETPALRSLLGASSLEIEQHELILERELLDNGKSRAYVNGRVVTLSLLRELAPSLADIHGQHEQQSLFSTRTQLEMLDTLAGTTEAADEVETLFRTWRECERRISELRGDEQERQRLLDLYRFQFQEIEQAELAPGEEERLEQDRRALGNLERVQQTGTEAYDRLYDDSSSVSTQLATARRALEELAQYDAKFGPLAEALESARATVDDAALEIRSYLDRLEADPERLNEVESRLALIEKLKRKYGRTLDEVLEYGRQAGERLGELESRDETLAKVEKEQQQLADQFVAAAQKLSDQRRGAAERLEKQVEKELGSLAMERARFRVAFEPVEPGPAGWSAHGIDRVVFMVSANPGQPPRPLAQVASGGELSRITLALKASLAPGEPKNGAKRSKTAKAPRTLVFDEIDTGVGGRVAEAIGRRLQKLSAAHQVLCVTHLSQIAGFADAHYFVDKTERNGLTFATIAELSDEARVQELARMLSGEQVTGAALEHARQLLQSIRKTSTSKKASA